MNSLNPAYTVSTVTAAMRDGTLLVSDVYLPHEPVSGVLLQRTPYGRRSLLSAAALSIPRAIERGYGIAIQDVRGRGDSDGTFIPFEREGEDGYDTVEWLGGQDWSGGRVGMYGVSYVALNQWLAARENPRALLAIAPMLTASHLQAGWISHGGALTSRFLMTWVLQSLILGDVPPGTLDTEPWATIVALVDDLERTVADPDVLTKGAVAELAPYVSQWVAHLHDTDYWARWSPESFYAEIGVPTLNVDGWFDLFQSGGIDNFIGMENNGAPELAHRLIVGPWAHASPMPAFAGEKYFGYRAASSVLDLDGRQLDFFDRHLQDRAPDRTAVTYFMMGENAWRSTASWPPAGSEETSLFLTSDGLIAPAPQSNDFSRQVTFDPANPVTSKGGRGSSSAHPLALGGSYRLTGIESDQAAYFETTPKADSLEIAGPVGATLFVSGVQTRTDVVAVLMYRDKAGDLWPVTDGVTRIQPDSTTEDEDIVVPVSVNLGNTALRLAPGETLVLQITLSLFPRFDLASEASSTLDIVGGARFASVLRIHLMMPPQLSVDTPS